jgi:flavin reductase (DIM6/NTAB) family NADH-FMN oxidoreductase RutF
MPPTGDEFRGVMGRFTTGVTVISAPDGGVVRAATVCAVAPVTLEPPTVLVCVNRSSDTESAIRVSGRFAVNVLTTEQREIADACARKGDDKLVGVPFAAGPDGTPVVPGALAHLACRVTEAREVGTHSVFLGVVEATATGPGSPLTVFRGGYGTPTAPPEAVAA